jgi:hypothetical protein
VFIEHPTVMHSRQYAVLPDGQGQQHQGGGEVYLFQDDTSMSHSLVDIVHALDDGGSEVFVKHSEYSEVDEHDLLEVISSLNEE